MEKHILPYLYDLRKLRILLVIYCKYQCQNKQYYCIKQLRKQQLQQLARSFQDFKIKITAIISLNDGQLMQGLRKMYISIWLVTALQRSVLLRELIFTR